MINNESIDRPSIQNKIILGSKRELLEIFSEFDTSMNIDSKSKDTLNSEDTSKQENDTVLMAMGPDNEIYLTINKRILNMEAGDKILKNIEEIGKKPVKEIIPPTINQSQNKKKIISNKIQNIQPKTQLPNKLLKSSENKMQLTNITNPIKQLPLQDRIKKPESQIEIDFYDKNLKIERLKITYKEFFLETPRCDVCSQIGITLSEIHSKNNKIFQMDSFIYDYLLLNCANCKLFVHKNCLDNEIPKKNNILDKSFEWKCERCIEFISKVNLNSNSNNNINCNTSSINSNSNLNLSQKWSLCQICHKNDSECKKPHLYKLIDTNNWVHFNCYLWISELKNDEDKRNIQEKLNDISSLSKYNNNCYICQVSNEIKFSPTIKCSANDCSRSYHPICLLETICFYELISLDNKVLAFSSFCEAHSKNYLISQINKI